MTRDARNAASLRLAGIERTFSNGGSPSFSLRGISLDVERHECLVILGPSGSGKTTVLRLVAGLDRPDAGRVYFDGVDVTRLPPERRGTGVVFAEDALFPHMTAFENIAYGVPRGDRGRVVSAARSMHVEAFLERSVAELSGGERQRVALARAIASKPAMLLLDEPLARLDAPLRLALRLELVGVLRAGGYTTMLVTHDQSEAMALGDRIAVMHDGAIEQVGTSRDLYARPANVFVAGFVGSPAMALVPAARFPGFGAPDAWTIGLRADAVSLGCAGDFDATVAAVEDFGADAFAYCETPGGSLVAKFTGAPPSVGERVALRIDPHAVHSFDARGSRIEQLARV